MTFIDAFLLAIAVVVAAKTVAWLIQLRTGNGGVVDPIWAWSLGLLAVLFGVAGTAPVPVQLMVVLMGGIWGMRLGTHLWGRMAGKGEDFRYAKFRAQWGPRANFNLFFFYQFQNLFTLVLAASAFGVVAFRPDLPPWWALVLAPLIWGLAVVGEGVADAQMDRFRRNLDNRGLVCREGLWRYSRHPNYFFECVHWLAYAPLAWGAPYGWAVLVAPVVMALLLTKISGMPMLEADMAERKPGYAEYMRTTSPLIPWFPKKTSP
jgi:steroid 5-alpha reductase family enzyme